MIRILLIEDDENLAELISESVEQLGFDAELETAAHAARGLNLAKHERT